MDGFARWLFRLAMRLHRWEDRLRFGAEMERLFEEDVGAARRVGRAAALRVAVRESWDMARAALAERMRNRSDAVGEGRRARSHWMERTMQDLRYALRSLMRRPGFSVLAVLTVALGTGATTAIFSVVNGVLLRSLPYAEPERLVRIWQTRTQSGGPGDGSVSPVVFKDWQSATTSFESMAVWTRTTPTLARLGEPEVVTGARVSPDFFRVFRSDPVLGRAFTAEEDLPQGPRAVVVSHSFWQQRLGGARDVLERTLELNGQTYSIVGVAASDFEFPAGARLWLPVRNNDNNCNRGCVYLNTIARLRAGVSVTQARAELSAVSERLAAEYPDALTNVTAAAGGLQETMVGDVRPALYILLAATLMVLLIACANVANLLIARGATRADELAVRVAMGAGRSRILFQLLTESVVLALCGVLAGLGLAYAGVRALRMLSPGDIPRLDEVAIDSAALGFSLGLAVATSLLFGLWPALQMARASVAGVLREGSGRTTGGRRGGGRATLLAAEVALSLVLLVGAGLLLRSFAAMLRVDPGYRMDGLARIGLSLSPPKYTQPEHAVAFFGEVERRLEAMPGVTGVTQALTVPLTTNILVTSFARTDRPAPPPGEGAAARLRVIGNDYFETFDIALTSGRSFSSADRAGAMAVAIVNRRLAEQFYPGEDPIGKAVSVGVSMGFPESDPRTIVGVVEDVRTENLLEPPEAELYVPAAQTAPSSISFVIAARDPEQVLSDVRQEIRVLDADLPIRLPTTLRELRLQQTARPRFYLALLALFAALAVVLAAVGLYGVVSFLVAQRRREIGVRLALGASTGSVIRLVIREGLRPALYGAGLGLATAFAGVKLLNALLFGIAPRDPLTFATTTALLLSVVVVACLVPARRATRISPASALKTER
jgi:putative ABC transport system permease protein